MRVLVFCDDLHHPAATARTGLAPLEAAGFQFDWVEDATDWNPVKLKRYDLVLLSKSNVRSHTDQTPWLSGPAETFFSITSGAAAGWW